MKKLEKPLKISGKLLVTRNTRQEFRCDDADFEVAKHILWYEWEGHIVTKTKGRFEEHVGITGKRVDSAPYWDFRRQFYVLK